MKHRGDRSKKKKWKSKRWRESGWVINQEEWVTGHWFRDNSHSVYRHCCKNQLSVSLLWLGKLSIKGPRCGWALECSVVYPWWLKSRAQLDWARESRVADRSAALGHFGRFPLFGCLGVSRHCLIPAPSFSLDMDSFEESGLDQGWC